jgi:hypothetical protein
MKKTLLFLPTFFCLLQTVFGQNDMSLQFFGKSLDTIDSYAYGSKQYEHIFYDKKTMVCRKYFTNSRIVSEEYVLVAKDTFLFSKYDSLFQNIMERGKVVPIYREAVDTFITYNPDTYEEQITVMTYNKCSKWSKTGFWTEAKNDNFYEGFYKNDVRIGKWFIAIPPYNKKHLYYDDNGKLLYEEPFNLVGTNNPRIEQALQGVWYAEYIGYSTFKLSRKKQNQYVRLLIFTFKNGKVSFVREPASENREEDGTYTIDNANSIIFKGFDPFLKNYKIIFINDDSIELQRKE